MKAAMQIDPDDEITAVRSYKSIEDEYFEAKAEREGMSPIGPDRPTRDMRPMGLPLGLTIDLSNGVPLEVVDDECTEPHYRASAA
jgi:hypothetical protein